MALQIASEFDPHEGIITYYAGPRQTTDMVRCAYGIGRDLNGVPQIDFSDGQRMWLLGTQAVVEIDAGRNVTLREFDSAGYCGSYWDLMALMAAESWRGATEEVDAGTLAADAAFMVANGVDGACPRPTTALIDAAYATRLR